MKTGFQSYFPVSSTTVLIEMILTLGFQHLNSRSDWRGWRAADWRVAPFNAKQKFSDTKRKQTCFHHQSQCLIYTALRWTGGWFSITLQTVHPYTWFINLNQTIWWLKTSKTIVLMLGSGYSTKSAFSCSNHWRVATKINNYRSLELKVSERNLHLRQHYRKQISVCTFISFWSRCNWK